MSYAIIVMGVAAAAGAVGARNQAKANQQVAQNNAAIAEMQAQDAEIRGEKAAQQVRRNTSQMVGTQRAVMAARGLDLAEGTPADIIDQTDFFGQVDEQTTRNNAKKEAWNARAQKVGYNIEAAANNPNTAFTTSLLGSAGSVASAWSTRSGKK